MIDYPRKEAIWFNWSQIVREFCVLGFRYCDNLVSYQIDRFICFTFLRLKTLWVFGV